jgi:hypothetical protein
MASDDILTDDYVAGLLAKDAKESSIKYSAVGLDAFKESKYVARRYDAIHANRTKTSSEQAEAQYPIPAKYHQRYGQS